MTPCIEWTKSRTRDGYGRTRFAGRYEYAHRVALMWKLGRALLPGHVAMHICDNPGCVNQDHLIEGTAGDNSRDRTSKGRQAKGRALPHAKLTCELAHSMRSYRAAGYTIATIAKMFGVSPSCASQVCRGESWV